MFFLPVIIIGWIIGKHRFKWIALLIYNNDGLVPRCVILRKNLLAFKGILVAAKNLYVLTGIFLLLF